MRGVIQKLSEIDNNNNKTFCEYNIIKTIVYRR